MPNALDYLKLPNPGTIAQEFEAGLNKGRVQSALAAFSKDPTSEASIAALMRVDPATALKLRDHQREEAKYRRDEEFRGALAGYMRAQRPTTGALASMGGLGGSAGRSTYPGANVVASDGAASNLLTPQGTPEEDGPARPDFSSLGQPESDADQFFLQMLERDPVKAMEVQSKLRDNLVDQLKATREGYSVGLAMLAGVRDEPTYQQRRTQIIERLAPLGMDASTVLPEQFPGEDGLRDIQLQALGVKDQLSLFLQQANLEADNERADRNTDSLIADRADRRGIQRRGQDIRSSDMRRGQDVRAGVTRRGQDLRGSGGGRRAGGAGRESLPVVSSPAEAMKLPSGTKFKTPDGRVKVRP